MSMNDDKLVSTNLKAGAAQRDITPKDAVWQSGWVLRDHKSEGVADPLCTKALVITDGAVKLAIISNDLVDIQPDLMAAVRKIVSHAVPDLKPENILMGATHTHFAPELAESRNPEHVDIVYKKWLIEQIRDIVIRADSVLEPAWIGCGKGRGKGLGFNRRIMGADGRAEMHFIMPDDLSGLTLGPNDDEIGVVKLINDEDELIASVVNFACHPVTEMELMYEISADYPAYIAEVIDSFEAGVTVFMQGPCGNIVPFKRERNQRCKIGRAVGAEALRLIQQIEVGAGAPLVPVQRFLKLPGYKSDEPVDVEVQVFALGNILLVGMPGEVFTEIGMRIKEKSGYDRLFIYELTNGSPVDYVPTREAYEEGGYEAISSKLAPGSGEKIADEIVAIIEEIKPLLPDKLTPRPEPPLSKYSLFAMGGYIEKKKEMEKEE